MVQLMRTAVTGSPLVARSPGHLPTGRGRGRGRVLSHRGWCCFPILPWVVLSFPSPQNSQNRTEKTNSTSCWTARADEPFLPDHGHHHGARLHELSAFFSQDVKPNESPAVARLFGLIQLAIQVFGHRRFMLSPFQATLKRSHLEWAATCTSATFPMKKSCRIGLGTSGVSSNTRSGEGFTHLTLVTWTWFGRAPLKSLMPVLLRRAFSSTRVWSWRQWRRFIGFQCRDSQYLQERRWGWWMMQVLLARLPTFFSRMTEKLSEPSADYQMAVVGSLATRYTGQIGGWNVDESNAFRQFPVHPGDGRVSVVTLPQPEAGRLGYFVMAAAWLPQCTVFAWDRQHWPISWRRISDWLSWAFFELIWRQIRHLSLATRQTLDHLRFQARTFGRQRRAKGPTPCRNCWNIFSWGVLSPGRAGKLRGELLFVAGHFSDRHRRCWTTVYLDGGPRHDASNLKSATSSEESWPRPSSSSKTRTLPAQALLVTDGSHPDMRSWMPTGCDKSHATSSDWVGEVAGASRVWWRDIYTENSSVTFTFSLTTSWSVSEKDNENKKMMDDVKRLHECGAWERHEFEQYGCTEREAADKSVTLDQERCARKVGLVTMSLHRRKHVSHKLTDGEHSLAKRGGLNWFATQSMIQLVAPLSLIETLKEVTGECSKCLNRLVWQVNAEASDKLHCLVLHDPILVFFADASWDNRTSLGSQCGCICIGAEGALLDGGASLCCPIAWHSRRCPRAARWSGSAETQAATQAQEGT